MSNEETGPAIDPGEGYRLIEKGEICKKGDQFWCPVRRAWVDTYQPGEPRGLMLTYRRKMEVDFAVDPGEGYRLLEKGEILEKGDCYHSCGIWYDTGHPGEPVGETNRTLGCTYRRKVETPKVEEIQTEKEPEVRRRSIYIAGPMRGIKLYNFPAFDMAAETLFNQGWDPVNPADLDRAIGYYPEEMVEEFDWNSIPESLPLATIIKKDLDALQTCDAIYMLKGWEGSKGAKAELAVAKWMGCEVLFEGEDGTEFESADAEEEDILLVALRLTKGDRQASYGPPDQDFRRTADMWTALFGHAFEPKDVALAMILLKASRQIHQRKRDNWVDIAGYARCGSICDEVA